MSPELVAPEKFGFKKSQLTISSDCYALGMVIYETICGKVPFHEHTDIATFVKVMLGEHPTRGEMFPERLWGMMELCWASNPKDRPGIRAIFWCLQRVSSSSSSPFGPGEEVKMGANDWNSLGSSPAPQRGTNSAMVIERSTPTSPDPSHAVDRRFDPVPHVLRPPAIEAASEAGVRGLGLEGTHPYLSISPVNSSAGFSHLVCATRLDEFLLMVAMEGHGKPFIRRVLAITQCICGRFFPSFKRNSLALR